jgi:hypothetical protein
LRVVKVNHDINVTMQGVEKPGHSGTEETEFMHG